MHRRGFTLLEILIIVAILVILVTMSVPIYTQYLLRSDLANAVQLASQGIERARLLAQSGQNADAWGFSASGVLFRGTSYNARNPYFDELYHMPDTIQASGIQVVVFDRITGQPSVTGDMIFTTYDRSAHVTIAQNY